MTTNKVYKDEWRVKDRARAKQWYEDNKHKPEVIARYQKAAENVSYEKQLYKNTKAKCKRLGIPFDLELVDIVIPDVCPVFQTPFVKGTMAGASLDRFNPTKGYTKGNICVMSRLANAIKNCGTSEQHRAIADWMDLRIAGSYSQSSGEEI